jgi:hypothetical protein
MASTIERLNERKATLQKLHGIRSSAANSFAIHYSCESFYDTADGRTARVTSIAIRNLSTGQTHSFSIHKIAEQKGVARGDIPAAYDDLEHSMLEEYFEFSKEHPGHVWVHWNMRDINYGFFAIEHRYKVLKGVPYRIADDKKFDLARALVSIYGRSYIGHGASGRFLNICRKNHITELDALTGAEEAKAFETQEYVNLHRSTLRKVDMMANLFVRTEEGSIKTDAKWKDIYGFDIKTVGDFIKQHWLFSLSAVVVVIAGWVVKAWTWFESIKAYIPGYK